MFAKAAKSNFISDEVFLECKMVYVAEYGQLQLLQLLKTHKLHTINPNRHAFVRDLLDATRDRTDATKDSSEETIEEEEEPCKKRRREPAAAKTFSWLPVMATEFANNLMPKIREYLPKQIDAKTVAKWMTPEVCAIHKLLTRLTYSSRINTPQFQNTPRTPHLLLKYSS